VFVVYELKGHSFGIGAKVWTKITALSGNEHWREWTLEFIYQT